MRTYLTLFALVCIATLALSQSTDNSGVITVTSDNSTSATPSDSTTSTTTTTTTSSGSSANSSTPATSTNTASSDSGNSSSTPTVVVNVNTTTTSASAGGDNSAPVQVTGENKITNCTDNCRYCKDASSCYVCNDGYFVTSDFKCSKCDPVCKTCMTNATKCISCTGINMMVIQGICQCAKGYYQSGSDCKMCPEKCKACVTDSICTECIDGYGLDKTTASCKLQCAMPCATCQIDKATACHSCIQPDLMDNRDEQCFCKTGYFMDSNQCRSCESGCDQCTNDGRVEFFKICKGVTVTAATGTSSGAIFGVDFKFFAGLVTLASLFALF